MMSAYSQHERKTFHFRMEEPTTYWGLFSCIGLLSVTSLVSAHFAENSRAIYLDVFSCAPYDPQDAAEFALEYFKGRHYHLHVVQRN